MVLPLGLCLFSWAGVWAPAQAQTAPEDLLPLSDFEDDPIGVGKTRAPLQTKRAQAPREAGPSTAVSAARFGPQPPSGRGTPGPALRAASGVRETRYEVTVRLARHAALVTLEQHFEHRLDRPSEVSRRLPVPPGTQITGFEVCSQDRCRRGKPSADADPNTVDAYDAAVFSRPRRPSAPPLPVGRVRVTPGAKRPSAGRGFPMLQLDLAPVSKDRPLHARITLQVPVAQHGGTVRLTWPAQAMDPFTAPRDLRVEAPGLSAVRPPGADRDPVRQDPWSVANLSAKVPQRAPIQATATRFPCPGRRGPGKRGLCASLQLDAGPQPLRPADVILAIDASPSMQGPARSRLAAAISSLLLAMPQGSQVRAMRFAGRAVPLLSEPSAPTTVSLERFRPALREAELGSATRLESAMDLASQWFGTGRRRGGAQGLRKLLVVLGDGGITVGAGGGRADRIGPVDRRYALSVVNLADRELRPALQRATIRHGGTVVDAGVEAAAAMRGADPAPLQDKLSALFATPVTGPLTLPRTGGHDGAPARLPALRAGDQLTWRGEIVGERLLLRGASVQPKQRRVPLEPSAGASWLAVPEVDRHRPQTDWPASPRVVSLRPNGKPRACDRRGPAYRAGGQSREDAPLQVAYPRRCRLPPGSPPQAAEARAGAGMPSSPLLQMLRERIIPVARGCLRRDRAGRADYAVRAVFRFTLAEREIVRAHVEGKLAPALRRCLRDAVDGLLVPNFHGTVRVSYPIRTLRETLPSQIELSAGTAAELERVLTVPE